MNLWLYSFFACELLVVSWIDLRQKKISNLWAILNALLAIIFWSTGILGPWSYQVLIFPIGFIVIGFFLFILKVMGAGDSKFLASLFLCLPISLHIIYFENLMMSTIAVGIILLVLKILKDPSTFRSYLVSRHWQGIKNLVKSHFSYAPVMLLAWILLGVGLWK